MLWNVNPRNKNARPGVVVGSGLDGVVNASNLDDRVAEEVQRLMDRQDWDDAASIGIAATNDRKPFGA